jgi:hypothetical protein
MRFGCRLVEKLENFVLEKTQQPATADDGEWRSKFVLD